MGKEQRIHGMNVQPGQGLGLINAPRKGTRQPLPKKAIACMVAACFAADVAVANPANPSIINGVVSFDYNGSTLTITNTPGSIINWQGFSIGVDELTRFIQQSASSAVLNRVTGVDPSVILGALQSNGHVFLINPNGVLFGAGSQIDVAGLVASSLNLSDADFLAGNLNFTATAGAGNVANAGNISAGSVYLIAPNVENSGIITSPNGEVVLAAGHSVQLVGAGTPNLRVEVAATDNQALNLGQIVADSGSIGIYAGLVSNSGTLNASSAVAEGGKIVLKATQTTNAGGTITATGTQGGTVHVLGDTVNVDGNIDVSGTNGGGTILVGGDYQGSNPDIQNASFTNVSGTLTADAIQNGNGGKIIVWSDDTTHFDGHVSARGGADGGNGGFAEISGKQHLYLNGFADLRAANGAFGTLLLDPGTVLICHLGGGSCSGGEGGPDKFTDDYLITQLNLGNLTISTSLATGAEGVAEDINIESDVQVFWSESTIFTLNAGNDINSFGDISATGENAGVAFNAGNSINIADTSSITAPAINMNAGNAITIFGNVTAQNGLDTFISMTAGSGGILIDGAEGGGNVEAFSGDGAEGGGVGGTATIVLNGGAGGLTVNNDGEINAEGGDGGEDSSGGNAFITFSGTSVNFTDSQVEVHGGVGDISPGNPTNGGSGNLTVNAGAGGINLDNSSLQADGGQGNYGGVGGAANVVLNASGALNMTDSSASAYGGGANSASGGDASVNVLAGSVNVFGVYGDEGFRAKGGNSNSGSGGAANLFLNTAGAVSLQYTGVYSLGGTGIGGNGGDATLGIVGGGGINVLADGGEMTSIHAYGGNGGGVGNSAGDGMLGLFSATGDITIDGDDVVVQGGSVFFQPGAAGNAVATLSTGGQIIIKNEGYVEADGGVFIDGESFGYGDAFVNLVGLAGITLDNESYAGAYDGSAIVYLATNGSLNVLNGSYVEAVSYNGAGGLVLVDAGQDVNVVGSGSSIYATDEVDIVVGGTVNLSSDGGEDGGATIETGSADSIFINFRNLLSGGYFVNGQEGVIYDPLTQTGFVVDGEAGILNENLHITYGGGSQEEGLPDEIINALNTITDETNKILKKKENDDGDEDSSSDSDDDSGKPSCS